MTKRRHGLFAPLPYRSLCFLSLGSGLTSKDGGAIRCKAVCSLLA
jgi:hypothetical protein